ncbi:MAG: aldehyde ferredoxin oxidoreductase family protein [Desulfurella sp.]|uniref:aldehyde ferredoxin oxidoreductase family protein n=1 Tax=Desulfurella sp. TaxID=1962857 RepID=UPI003C8A9460
MEIDGYSDKILYVNLSKKSFYYKQVNPEDRRLYLGAKGLGLKLLFDNFPKDTDPLASDNPIIIMPGIVSLTNAHCSARFSAVTISPLTNIVNSSSCGGPFGIGLKKLGLGGLVVVGKSEKPVYLYIEENSVNFLDASDIWGRDSKYSQDFLKKKYGSDSILTIAQAGENLVRFANVVSGTRFLGRGGIGAVFGSKLLKAVVTKPISSKAIPKNRELFDKVKKKSLKYIENNEFTSFYYRRFGTSSNIISTNAKDTLPVMNFRFQSNKKADGLFAKNTRFGFNLSFETCKPCSILCGHKIQFNNKIAPYPEYETLALVGSNLGIFDINDVVEINELCNLYGMDTISLGGTLAWAMQASSQKIFPYDIKFGDAQAVKSIIKKIALQEGIGAELAQGSMRLSKKYGGSAFAMNVKGLELAGYHPSGAYGQALSYAVANRGACHLSAFPVGLEIIFDLLDPKSTKGKAAYVVFFENLFASINSLQTCLFTAFAYLFEPPLTKYTPHFILKKVMSYMPKIAISLIDYSLYWKLFVSITGIKISKKEFLKAGERIIVLERYLNCLLGVSNKDDTLPNKFLVGTNPIPLEIMLKDYYRLRSYDSNGHPEKKLLKNLGIISE